MITPKFKPMTEFPPRVKDKLGNLKFFSETVLVYDNLKDKTYCEFGFYDFDGEEWFHFGKKEMDLLCWIEIPKIHT